MIGNIIFIFSSFLLFIFYWSTFICYEFFELGVRSARWGRCATCRILITIIPKQHNFQIQIDNCEMVRQRPEVTWPMRTIMGHTNGTENRQSIMSLSCVNYVGFLSQSGHEYIVHIISPVIVIKYRNKAIIDILVFSNLFLTLQLARRIKQIKWINRNWFSLTSSKHMHYEFHKSLWV